MKKVLSATAFIFFSLIYAQDLGKEISLSQNWISVIKGENLNLSNGRVTNHTNKSTRKLSLDYYLSATKFNPTQPSVAGILVAKNPLKPIKGNNSISGISISNSMVNLPADGTYYQILILTDQSGTIKDAHNLNKQIVIESGKINFKEEEKKEALPQTVKSLDDVREINKTDALTDLNKPIKINALLDESLTLEKEWKINIDFANFMVNLTGGDIANNKLEDSQNLQIDVYLTQEKQEILSSDFSGVHIATAPIQPLAKAKRFTGASIKTNLRAIVPQGTYHIFMTLSEVDATGNAVVKSTKLFANPVTL